MDPASLIVTALALVAFGTGGDTVTTTTTTSRPTLETPLTMTVSAAEVGGVSERIVISPDGSAWIRNGDGARLTYEISRRELNSVAAAADIAFAGGSRRLPLRCLDCTLYSVRMGSERISFDAVGLDRSGFSRNLVRAIAGSVPDELTR